MLFPTDDAQTINTKRDVTVNQLYTCGSISTARLSLTRNFELKILTSTCPQQFTVDDNLDQYS